MDFQLIASTSNPPLGALLLSFYHDKEANVKVQWQNGASSLKIDGKVVFTSNSTICHYLARVVAKKLYSSEALVKTEINHWCNFADVKLTVNGNAFEKNLKELDKILSARTFLCGNSLTLGDIQVFSTLYGNSNFHSLLSSLSTKNLMRWFHYISSQKFVVDVLAALPKDYKMKLTSASGKVTTKDEGKFIELPDAKMGEVVVRFPPEASGFLHIGHAKAALLNQHYQNAFKGKLIMRFDDTNPAKEKADFEKVILEDLKLLEVYPDIFSHTSDFFEYMLKACEKLIKEGKAYVDNTEPETMKIERENRVDSVNRNNSVEKNMNMWNEMIKGSSSGQKCCVRAKIDMKSDNGCMRDPAMYRCKDEPHVRTGTKYKVYPTYDFACPIVDSLEGVTHALRTTEYHDRDDQFFWFIDALGLRKPHVWEYSRLNMMYTVLSKRKLTWFVDQGIVDGWDDPRFPTVRGVLRRGMTVEGLRQFIIAQGSSRSVVLMEWDKIWAFNKKVIDPVASRYFALDKENLVPVNVTKVSESSMEAQLHPKDVSKGMKTFCTGPNLLIEKIDAEALKENTNATFINWGNLMVKKINRNASGNVESIDAEPNLENKDYKKTLKLTWLAASNEAKSIPCICVFFDDIMTKPALGKDDDFKDFVNKVTKVEVMMLGEQSLANVKKSEIIQLQRKGFFICDEPYEEVNRYSGRESPIILFSIPDGSMKTVPYLSSAKTSSKVPSSPTKVKATKNISENTKLSASNAAEIFDKIVNQGNNIRELKSAKAPKETITNEVQTLLSLKAQFKQVTGSDWTPKTERPAEESAQPSSPTKAKATKNINENTKPSDSDSAEIFDKIVKQGNKIRELKSAKAPKETITNEVQTLLSLKAQFKQVTGSDWTPQTERPAEKSAKAGSVEELNSKIISQGNKVREAKTNKVEKKVIEEEVKILLSLKAEFKLASGQDWKPGLSLSKVQNSSEDISQQIKEQGDLVRNLKLNKKPKEEIDQEVKKLLTLKGNFKEATGKDWKPENNKNTSTENSSQKGIKSSNKMSVDDSVEVELKNKIDAQGQIVRDLKSSSADKSKIDTEVKKLLALKAEYKEKTGIDVPGSNSKKTKKEKKDNNEVKKKEAKSENKNDNQSLKKVTRLGLEATKEDNLPEWYSQTITKAEMIEYYDVSGCYILRPWAFGIWEKIVEFFDQKIKAIGVKNCYFPMFVSQHALEKEKSHISDFAPEVAWVTKSGSSDLAEPIAIRPTSETVMYPAYAKWIQSHRDLPLKMNQWCNVVRWEFKHPQPFLRTREFLWQEGHTAFANKEDACKEVHQILDYYGQIYTDLLAIPVIKGKKTEKEKFAGGDFTTTVEVYINASGRAIQGATSHHLGQNFSKMFEIIYEDPKTKQKEFVYQNSWGITTRTIGVMTMVHGDNSGLVLPPNVASVQAIIIPCGITASLSDEDKNKLIDACETLEQKLTDSGIRVSSDTRDNYSPGWKFNHWELKGVPIRIELGPRDLKQGQFVMVRRDTGEKCTGYVEKDTELVKDLLKKIQTNMYDRAKKIQDEHVVVSTSWNEFCTKLDKKCLIQAPFCGIESCEDKIKKESAREESSEPGAPSMGAKSLCIPFDQPAEITENLKCIHPKCTNKPQYYTMFGRSY